MPRRSKTESPPEEIEEEAVADETPAVATTDPPQRTEAELRAELSTLEARIREAQEGRVAAEKGLSEAKLHDALTKELEKLECRNVEQTARILAALGKLGVDEEGALTCQDPGDVDPALTLNAFKAEHPQLFTSGPARTQPAGPKPTSKFDRWRAEINRAR